MYLSTLRLRVADCVPRTRLRAGEGVPGSNSHESDKSACDNASPTPVRSRLVLRPACTVVRDEGRSHICDAIRQCDTITAEIGSTFV